MSEVENKTKTFLIRLTESQKEQLFQRAAKMGYSSVAQFVLDAALKREIRNYDVEYKMFHLINDLYAEFGKTGSNINQIAKHLNTHKDQLPISLLKEVNEELKSYNKNREVLINHIKNL